MTEAEWLTNADHEQLLLEVGLTGGLHPRVWRLFGVAACRLLEGRFFELSQAEGLAVAERYADGEANDGDLRGPHADARNRVFQFDMALTARYQCETEEEFEAEELGLPQPDQSWRHRGLSHAEFEELGLARTPAVYLRGLIGLEVASSVAAAVLNLTTPDSTNIEERIVTAYLNTHNLVRAVCGALNQISYLRASGEVAGADDFERWRDREYSTVCDGVPDLFRDIVGNPFRSVTLDRMWLTTTVTALASAIYAERAFDRMSILADALQDAGCDNDDILRHCRGQSPHVRGCWVIDLLLGRR